MFDTLSDRLESVFTALRGKGRLSEADIDATAREIRLALLEADVALPVVKAFIAALKERARVAKAPQGLNPAQQVIKIVHEELVGILGGEPRRLRFAKQPPTVIMLAGLQGSGKTTLAGKLARWLKGQGHQPMLVAADLQRPNAVTQLQVLGQRAGVEVFAPEPGDGVGDRVAAARASREHARRVMRDVVIVDTAGRLGIDAEMMAQAAAIRDAVDPDEIIFVIDAMIGQDAVATAEAFRDGVGISGVVLSKLDGDARGGAALADSHFDGVTAIIRSMTPGERENPKIINGSRRARIARGSGVQVMDVNQLLNRFAEAQKMMKQMGPMMGLPGRRKATKSPKNKRKGTKGGSRPRGGLPGGFPGGMPALPPGLDPGALDPGALDPNAGFKAPKLDFGKLTLLGRPQDRGTGQERAAPAPRSAPSRRSA